MENASYKVIGLMSGTSLDGLDIAYCHFEKGNDQWRFSLLAAESIAYTSPFQQRLKNSIDLPALDLLVLNNEFGEWCGKRVKEFIQKNKLQVDFVASHGHTVFHQIDKKLTYQIGAGQELANHSGVKVICDFRSLDVALGGQGAPLVPIGDELLFADFDFCLNLGGISNISFKLNGKRIAFDVAPANMLLTHILNPTGKAFDNGGEMARKGNVIQPMLDELNALDFYRAPFPKSLGYEWFCEKVVPIVDAYDHSIEDKLCTAVHHMAFQIANAVQEFAQKGNRMLVTGGGAKNHFLVETLAQYLPQVEVVVPNQTTVDFKEAIVFGLMGVLKVREEINCLSSVTGAKMDSCSGVVYGPFQLT